MSKILIIDDSRLITQFGKSILTGKGHEVLTADSGELGLEMALRDQPDLVLLDVILPGMDGYQICQKLKTTAQAQDIPVIMLTSKAEPADKIKGLELGAVDYVTKPFDAGELIARVNTHLRMKELYEALQEKNRQLQEMANRDGLTDLYNHRFFHEHLTREMDRVRRYGGIISCVIVDIDFFKKVNDTYGHQAGDLILKDVADILQKGIRESDLAARYGGEEFALILLQTDAQTAILISERIRSQIAARPFLAVEPALHITASFGVASFPSPGMNAERDLVEAADQALYQAKKGGRNRVVLSNTGTAGI
ncbi:MAG: diguanylate cyclase [Deltaproteobacteria bacterium]|nr:diguanylate cyclase [Deltaproteobacteria bacterium]